MAEANRLNVRIFGNDVVLKSTRPDQEMERIVNYVQKQIEDARSPKTRYNKTMQVTLACINLADQLFETRGALDAVESDVASREEKIQSLEAALHEEVERSKTATAALSEREKEMQTLRRALEESENKRLEMAKQFQEYQRTHR